MSACDSPDIPVSSGMSYDPKLHCRRSIRLRQYDYTNPGTYFITVCAKHRKHLFGEIRNGIMRHNAFGRIVQHVWNELPTHYPGIMMDTFVIMPDHIHGIIVITDGGHRVGAQFNCAPTSPPEHNRHPNRENRAPINFHPGHPLGHIVRSIKSFSTRAINALRKTPGRPVWQRNYFEHIIRDERDLNRIRRYIHENPEHWGRNKNKIP
jgi:putative transposase